MLRYYSPRELNDASSQFSLYMSGPERVSGNEKYKFKHSKDNEDIRIRKINRVLKEKKRMKQLLRLDNLSEKISNVTLEQGKSMDE